MTIQEPEAPVVDPTNYVETVNNWFEYAQLRESLKKQAVSRLVSVRESIKARNKAAGIKYVHPAVKAATKNPDAVNQAHNVVDWLVGELATVEPQVLLYIRENNLIQDAVLMMSRQYKEEWDLTHDADELPSEEKEALRVASLFDAEHRKAVDMARAVYTMAVTMGATIPDGILKVNAQGKKELNLSKSQGQRITDDESGPTSGDQTVFVWVVDGDEVGNAYEVVRRVYPPSEWTQAKVNNLYDPHAGGCEIDSTVEINGFKISRPKIVR